MKKKICILQNGLDWGGTDTFVINLCKGLDKSQFDITVVNPSIVKRQREETLLQEGVNIIHTTPPSGIAGSLKHFFQLYKILRKGKFDIFQTNIDLFNGPNLFVAWLARVPMRVCHSHNSLQGRQLREGDTLSVRIYQKLMRWLCWNFSTRRCGCSSEANEFLYKGKDWAKASYPTVIYNGIGLSKFRHPVDKISYKDQTGLVATTNIITIGHLIDQKNPLFIAQFFADFCKVNDECNLIWIGDGVYKNQVLEILKQNKIEDRVHFFSKRDDIPQLLKCSDIFILPSNFEGLGIVAIEAQAAGLPVLLSDKIPHLADCGGAFYLPIDNGTQPWVKAAIELLRKDKTLSADNDRLSNFSKENMVKQMTEIFNS